MPYSISGHVDRGRSGGGWKSRGAKSSELGLSVASGKHHLHLPPHSDDHLSMLSLQFSF